MLNRQFRPLAEEESERLAAQGGVRVFVYGTLKKAHGNNQLLRDAEYLGRCAVTGRYKFYDTGYFPTVIRITEGSPTWIVGEVYKVNLDTLRSLDMLEGHPNWYERVQVNTSWNDAWIYTMPPFTVIRPGWKEIETCWRPSSEETEWIQKQVNAPCS